MSLNEHQGEILPTTNIASPETIQLDEDDKSLISLGDTSWINDFSKNNRQTRLTPENLSTWLHKIMQGSTMAEAAEAIGASRATVYEWINKLPQVKALYDEAMLHGTDIIEGQATKRAMEKSDLLMMFILKSRNREKFSDSPNVSITNNITLKTLLVNSIEEDNKKDSNGAIVTIDQK